MWWNSRLYAAALGILAALMLHSGSAGADTLAGMLDGEEREWHVLSYGSDSNATFIEYGDMVNLDVTGFIDPDSWSTREALSLSMTITEDKVVDFDVIHLIGGSAMPPLFTSEGADVTLTLDSLHREGRTIRVMGRVEGWLALQERLGTMPNMEEAIEIDVTFDIKASKIEF
ncbi:hypothetical protein R5M92_06070 [Halomonas sp. Bachu 37]|uniref:hypothetical protein n=1 Tax=Halomonas kashgarensis TaxID=3084920 RepID=UPI003216457A